MEKGGAKAGKRKWGTNILLVSDIRDEVGGRGSVRVPRVSMWHCQGHKLLCILITHSLPVTSIWDLSGTQIKITMYFKNIFITNIWYFGLSGIYINMYYNNSFIISYYNTISVRNTNYYIYWLLVYKLYIKLLRIFITLPLLVNCMYKWPKIQKIFLVTYISNTFKYIIYAYIIINN